MSANEFGCEQCCPLHAETAWEASRRFGLIRVLSDESHFGVSIFACPACGQHFASVFTETIDWVDGEDPQYWSLLPLRAEESGRLLATVEACDLQLLETFGRNRRFLTRSYPKHSEPTISWRESGFHIGPHD